MNLYVVRNKENGKCYVGQTKHDVARRLDAHHRDARKSILGRAMHRYGKGAFEFFCFYDIPVSLIDTFEIQLIALCNSMVPNGYNVLPGGQKNRPYKPSSDATREKISRALTGKPKSPEHVKKVADALKGRTVPTDRRKKISETLMGHIPWNKGLTGRQTAWNKGLPSSEETKQKLREARSKQPRCIMSEEQLEVLRVRMMGNTYTLGYKATEETKRKLSMAHMGKSMSQEARHKSSETQKGRPTTAETKRKISEKQKLRWAKKKAEEIA